MDGKIMTKRMLAVATLGLFFASGAQAQSIWSGRFAYENNPATAYPPNEFSLDLFGNYATRDKSGHSGDAWGLGLGANYFFTRNLGIGADTYADAFQVPYLINGSVIYRYPVMETGLAPYGFAGFGRQWEHAGQWTGHLGIGLEFRFNPHTGVFLDARRVFPDQTRDYAVWRAGLRLGF